MSETRSFKLKKDNKAIVSKGVVSIWKLQCSQWWDGMGMDAKVLLKGNDLLKCQHSSAVSCQLKAAINNNTAEGGAHGQQCSLPLFNKADQLRQTFLNSLARFPPLTSSDQINCSTTLTANIYYLSIQKYRFNTRNGWAHRLKKNGSPPKKGPKPPVVTFPPGPMAMDLPTAKPPATPPPWGPTAPPFTTGLAWAPKMDSVRRRRTATICGPTQQKSG